MFAVDSQSSAPTALMDEIAIIVRNKNGQETSFLVNKPCVPINIKQLIASNLARQVMWDVKDTHHIVAIQTKNGALCPDHLIPNNGDCFTVTISLYPIVSSETTPLILPTIP